MFSYELEDIDATESGADVFNGQQSVLWKNLRAAFPDELAAMYQNLRSTGALSYEKVERMFEEHQAKWPEAIFNEDAYYKYLQPLIDDGTGSYLSMLQGSKAEQRKWWLYNRFRYIDSKYNAGDALTDVIQLRGYAKANITVTPYADIYPSIKYGSYLVGERGKRNTSTTLVCPLDNVNDTEIYIYSASQLASVGDLSGLMVGFADFSLATRLQSLKIGDPSDGYSNGNLTTLNMGNNTLLQSIDVRNCPNLTQAIDLSGCSIIEEAYFGGTAVTSVSFPNGGVLKTLQLPGTITNLTIRNQTVLTSFEMPSYSNITTLRLENVGAIDPTEILPQMAANSRVRLIGLNLTLTSMDEVDTFYDLLDTMRGLDENGNNTDTAQVSGTITGLDSVTGAWLAEAQVRYPSIKIEYAHITSNLYYYNYDGSSLLYTEAVKDGGDGTYSGTPSRASTAQYSYTFVGWNTKTNQTSASTGATKAVTADRNVYAAYTATVRTYTVYFYNGSTLLQTVTNVRYGSSATYTGSTPVSSSGSASDYPFEGWSPSPTNITGNTSCYAQFGSPLQVAEISDSWEEIIAAVNDGTYKTKYKVGNYKALDLGTEGTVNMQIVAKDKEALADGSGTAPLSWLSMELLKTSRRMNPYLGENYGYVSAAGWNDYSNATSTSSSFMVGSASGLAASEDATWTVTFTAAIDFTVQATNFAVNSSGSGFANDYECEITADDTTIYKATGTTISVSAGTTKSYSTGDSVTIVLRFKQDSKASLNAYEYAYGYLKFTDSSGAQTSIATAAYGSNSSSWTSKATITKSTNQVRTRISYKEATGAIGGWEKSEMRTYLRGTVKPLIPEIVRSAIVSVTKSQPSYTTSGSWVTQTTADDVWIPSQSEVEGSSSTYYTVFQNTNANRIKYKSGASSATFWWLRSAGSTGSFHCVYSNGNVYNYNAYNTSGVALGFCI